MKKSVRLAGMLTAFLLLCGCGSSGEGSVYYLNFKAEQDEVWQQLAKEYTAKTGVEVAVISGF